MPTTRRQAAATAPPPPGAGVGAGDADAHHVPRIPLLGVMPALESFDAPIDRRSDFYRLQALAHVHEHPPPVAQQPLLVRARRGGRAASACSARSPARACRGPRGGLLPRTRPDRAALTCAPTPQNVPNVLTFARLVAVPVLVALWFAPLPTGPLWCAALFVGASFTDWLDGYIARQVGAGGRGGVGVGWGGGDGRGKRAAGGAGLRLGPGGVLAS
jgi:hypothetical protein